MTQDGDTGQDQRDPHPGARAEPRRRRPTFRRQAIPEAYLAPAARPAPLWQRALPARPARIPAWPAGQRRPAGHRPARLRPAGLRAPSNGRARFGPARARRDPAFAAPWKRAVASILDWTIILGVSIAIFLAPLVALGGNAGHPEPVPGPRRRPDGANNLSRDPSTLNTFLHIGLAAFGILLPRRSYSR